MFWKKPLLPHFVKEYPLNTPLKDLTFTVFDTETTGFAVGSKDRLIEIAAVHVRQLEVTEETFRLYVNPEREIPTEITELTSISRETIEDAPNSLEAIKAFLAFNEQGDSGIWVGHYISFDVMVLKKGAQRHQHRIELPICVDTLDLIGFINPSKHMFDLEKYASQFGTRMYERHQALGDALTTAHLFCELLYLLEQRGKRTFADLIEISEMNSRTIQF
ncbi:3'-5' exonuclease [Halalkalibacter nanhaiisediminis]|uniref:DNA polymerase-3 subunit epsilon n=1 Tax=Halalkalibacter nanhaiisediminis TaxID=688079 RepID=A0A562QSR1_9BACI|nr:DNA polymerase-3 subunit epsilon [Halalkalibacter nanhaiisediminis]